MCGIYDFDETKLIRDGCTKCMIDCYRDPSVLQFVADQRERRLAEHQAGQAGRGGEKYFGPAQPGFLAGGVGGQEMDCQGVGNVHSRKARRAVSSWRRSLGSSAVQVMPCRIGLGVRGSGFRRARPAAGNQWTC